jgi:hypothetical protein
VKRFCRALLGLSCCGYALAQTPTIDGALDPIYCYPLIVQDTQTGFGDASHGQIVGPPPGGNGSELDNAYGYVHDGMLYLFIGGNLESNGNDLEIFFDTRPGGQNTLAGDNPNIDANGLNRMGEGTQGPGLTFDAGFAADFYVTVQCNAGATPQIRVHYAELGNPGVGYFVGVGLFAHQTLGGALTDGDPGAPAILATINNSNTAGVTGGNGIEIDGGAWVTTGIELAIPLSALGNPTQDIRVTAFVNGAQHDFVSNQVLGGLFGAPNLGEPRLVNLNDVPFDQFFTIPLNTPPCGACCVSSECLLETTSGCAGFGGVFQGANASCAGNPCDAAAAGACCMGTTCSIETQFDCELLGGAYFGDDTSCDTFPCLTIGACCLPNDTCEVLSESECATAGGEYFGGGSPCTEGLCLRGACCAGVTRTTCIEVRENACLNADGIYIGDLTTCPDLTCVGGACCVGGECFIVRGAAVCAQVGGTYQGDNTSCNANTCGTPTPGLPVVDGTRDGSYGPELAVQDTQTGFGDSNLGMVDWANGSELDNLTARVVGDKLYIHIGGNIESNFNKWEMFFDTRSGGQNRLNNLNPDIDFNGLNRMGDDGTGNGLTFDAGFEADFLLTFGHGSGDGRPTSRIFANFAELYVDEINPGAGYFLGEGRANNYTNGGLLDRGDGFNPLGIRITVDNSNTAGVSGGDQLDPVGGSGVITGIELCIPLSAIGNPTGDIKVCTFVNGQGHDFASNQFLGGIGGGSSFGDPRNVNLSSIPGDQFVLIPLVSDPCAGVICGDANLSGTISVGDIGPFVTAVSQGFAAWDATLPGTQTMDEFVCANDTDGNGAVTVGDIGAFVATITAGSSQCQ